MDDKLWLVYMITPCEMGSEGWSGWSYYAVVKGETDEEIFDNWVCEVITIYNVDFSDDVHKNSDGSWSCRYYSLEKIELPRHVYGHAKPLGLSINYDAHDIDKSIKLWKINEDKILYQSEYARIMQWLDLSGTIASKEMKKAGIIEGQYDIYNSMYNAMKYIMLLREELEKRGVYFNSHDLVNNEKEK